MATATRSKPALGRALLDLLYPPHCVVCERAGAWLCADCSAGVPRLAAPFCPHCGRPMATARLCGRCRSRASQLEAIRTLGSYASPLSDAIQAFKYGGVRVLAEPLAALLADLWQAAPLPVGVVVPVALHPARERYRGYNQAVLLARAFGRVTGLPVESDALLRVRNTRAQVGLNTAERHSNMLGAFGCTSGALRGARVLLIDDVLTTGATLEAAAAAARAGGALGVWALTLARAQDPV